MLIEWWYWIVAGMALMLGELVIPTFVLVWFGASAIAVGLLLALLPSMSVTAQLVIWLIFSIALVIVWFRVFKENQHKTRIGMSDANILGEIGLLSAVVAPFQRGEVRFQKPILGSEVWPCIADETIAVGERVKIIGVEGSLIKVGRS